MNVLNFILRRSGLPPTVLTACLGIAMACSARSWGQNNFEGPPINYLSAEVNDPVAQLSAKLESGEISLAYDDKHGYLPALLDTLEVPISSQTLVFSKTSLQLSRISPLRPRALYFNDDVYIGFCQSGDVLEIATTDAQQGATFYTLRQEPTDLPSFVRDRGQCLSCHASNRTQDVPGYLVRSVFADRRGQPILGSGTFTTDHTSPLDERWGGWYVTGKHGSMRHMGNRYFTEEDSLKPDREEGANLESLSSLISTAAYLSPHSDIVALMVLEHQTQMHNAIAAANYETRQALHQSFEINALLDRPVGHISESAERRINASADRLLRYLLMCDEFPLTDEVRGTSGYAREFASRGMRDSKGRSLRDLDLTQRLFRYPCSYLIDSPAFDGLPDEVRTRVLKGLRDVLEGRDRSTQYAHLTAALRQELLEILRETKPEFGRAASDQG